MKDPFCFNKSNRLRYIMVQIRLINGNTRFRLKNRGSDLLKCVYVCAYVWVNPTWERTTISFNVGYIVSVRVLLYYLYFYKYVTGLISFTSCLYFVIGP